MIGVLGLLAVESNAELIQRNMTNESNQNMSLAQSAITKSFSSSEQNTFNKPHSEDSIIDKLNAIASSTVRNFSQNGVASWYGRQFHGRKTANGETFNMNELTAAHKSLPLNCLIRVTNKENGKSVVVRVNDRGPFHGNRVVDLSYGAAKVLGIVNSGTANVTIERIDN